MASLSLESIEKMHTMKRTARQIPPTLRLQTAFFLVLSLLCCACLVLPNCLPHHEHDNLILTATTRTSTLSTNTLMRRATGSEPEKEESWSLSGHLDETDTTTTTTTTQTANTPATTSNATKSRIRPSQLPEAMQTPWNDMDLTVNATCGVDKCFFRSISDSTLGYLVAGSDRHEAMVMAASFGQEIQREFHAKHLNINLPYTVNVSETFQQGLNNIVHQPNRNLDGWEPEDVFLTDDDVTYVVVQCVRVAPQPSLFLAVAAQNRQVTLQQLDTFRRQIPDKASFQKQFERELQTIQKVLKKYPKLHYDFQGMVDTTGNFYFMDLDGQSHQHKTLREGRLRETQRVQMKKLRETLAALVDEQET